MKKKKEIKRERLANTQKQTRTKTNKQINTQKKFQVQEQ
jgi:hypothetical protein